jgi:hypothetical protein
MVPKLDPIETFQEIARSKGGVCLSKKRLNRNDKLKFECGEGHIWETSPQSIKNMNSWCWECFKKSQMVDSLETYRQIARDRGGVCLSEEYLGSMKKLSFRCNEGHIWSATPNSIKSKKTWCRECATKNKFDSIETFQKIAVSKGGVCLSRNYAGQKDRLKFKCGNGHVFITKAKDIKEGKWCKECFIDNHRSGLTECQLLAKERGGECLSKTYVNQHTLMKWRCASKHEWQTRYSVIKYNGSWCPECSAGLGERITREFFEQLFNSKFPKLRPEWLVNERGNKMELDGFSQELGLAFEHQGEHHFSTKLPYSNTEILSKRIRDDKSKKNLCREHNVTLVGIPEVPRLLPIDHIKEYIKTALQKEILTSKITNCLANWEHLNVDYKKAYVVEPLNNIRVLAEKKGGKLISDYYLGIFEKLEFECERGHRFKLAPSHLIHRNQWCRKCADIEWKEYAKTIRKPIENLRELANNRSWRLITKESLGAHLKHTWICDRGHEIQMSPANVLMGKGCSICSKIIRQKKIRKKYEERFLQVVAEKEGIIIEGEYVNTRTKVTIECKHQHTWQVRPDSIIRGSWCQHCHLESKK